MEQMSLLGRFPLVFSAESLKGLCLSEVTSILTERLTHKVNADSDRLRFVPWTF
jgi:hypothetical protein